MSRTTQSFTQAIPGYLAGASLVVVATLAAPSAQAAIITGTVSGTWEYGTNIGDPFEATYTYDDAAITPFDYSNLPDLKHIGYQAPLLSLVVQSGTFTQTFDFSPGHLYNSQGIYFRDYERYPSQWKIFNNRPSPLRSPML